MNSSSDAPRGFSSLSSAQKAALKRNNFKNVTDLVLTAPVDLSKKLKVSLNEAQSIIENVCKELSSEILQTARLEAVRTDKFTTGDASLDDAIGGGIRTCMVWELAGESASGKTQLALQLSLLVQVRPILGGLSGSACYITTHAKLPTKRLDQLVSKHPLLSSSVCSLSDIHTVAVPTIDLLIYTLKFTLPALQRKLSEDSAKPIRLVVIDSISALFHTTEKPSTSALFERSRALSDLSRILHTVAAEDQIAFVVINDVVDVFTEVYARSQEGESKGDVIYRDQARWFNSAHSIPRENSKEAGLGLAWANQLNVRIMLTRTNRRRYLGDPSPLSKRRRLEEGATDSTRVSSSVSNVDDQPVLIRRLSVVFSSVSAPNSVDFIVTKGGISVVADETTMSMSASSAVSHSRSVSAITSAGEVLANPQPCKLAMTSSDSVGAPASQQSVPLRIAETEETCTFDGPVVPGAEVIPSSYPGETDELVDGGLYWEEFNDVSYDALSGIDFDGLDKANVEEDIQSSTPAASEETHI
ncbi:P-loop containing nucleoside triphosphate hydrolase protein [Phellopilus nigrolimitatus]|nr:P-loop containing nucleoside triphosphate hydrolase protein [Phellopilus nigrolimitatus]